MASQLGEDCEDWSEERQTSAGEEDPPCWEVRSGSRQRVSLGARIMADAARRGEEEAAQLPLDF